MAGLYNGKCIVLNPEQHAKFKIEAAKRRLKMIDAAKEAVELWLRNGKQKAA